MRIYAIFTAFLILTITVSFNNLCSLKNQNFPFQASFYSNQSKSDIKQRLIKSIKLASSRIDLAVFALNDPQIISALNIRASNVPIQIIVDKGHIEDLRARLDPRIKLLKIKQKGLMHHKTFLIDDQIFLGSTNLTSTSLRMHDNLTIEFVDQKLSKELRNGLFDQMGGFALNSNNKLITLWSLPSKNALENLIDCINTSSSSIKVAMFTLTHPLLVDALIQAKNRGVIIEVILDRNSSKGASLKAFEKLKMNNIKVFLSNGSQLMHHKIALIDQSTLIMGSTNWTVAAFEKNQDLLVKYELENQSLRVIKKIWRNLKWESKTG